MKFVIHENIRRTINNKQLITFRFSEKIHAIFGSSNLNG